MRWRDGLLVLTLAPPTPLAAAPLTVTKAIAVVADGVSAINPKALPGALLDEMLTVTNPLTNTLATVAGVAVTDTVPAGVKLCVRDLGAGGSGPLEFVDGDLLGLGLLGSGLSFRFVSLASTGDGVDFSGDGVTWTYLPAADASGCDAAIKAIRVRLSGTQAPGSVFRLRYRVKVK